MCIAIALSGALLFLILTPGVLLRIPQKGSVLTVAFVHSIIFGILLYFISKAVYQSYNKERFEDLTFDSLNKKITKIDQKSNRIRNFVTLLLKIQNVTTECKKKNIEIKLREDTINPTLNALSELNLENLGDCISGSLE